MVGKHPIYYNYKIVGNAEITKTGMFYLIACACNLPMNEQYRIQLFCNDLKKDLGLCVPSEKGIGLKVRLPMKHFTGDNLQFYVSCEEARDNWYPVSENTECECICQLSNAVFRIKNGQPGLLIQSQE